MEQPDVKLYTVSTCVHCRAARKFLDKCTVKYEFTDIDALDDASREAVIEDLRKLNPACSVPTIIIGEKVIVGFREPQIREALGLK